MVKVITTFEKILSLNFSVFKNYRNFGNLGNLVPQKFLHLR